ncbi:MAG: hypothetical protein F4X66_03140 [Chloroflexi bacterium]|nr:hypothetical protein [Chloroflexota bacterium]MYE40268.1 hypothetical protein [Chloroflexota bacterium]
MTDSTIQPGAFVWYAAKGLGSVREVGGSPAVLFWADEKSGATQSIPPALLTSLKSNGAEDFGEWAKNSPLTLVALALSACGGDGRESDIREKLNGRAPLSPNWAGWWKRTKPKLGNLPAHFAASETSEGIGYKLLSGVADVPPDWTQPKSATLADWKKWLSADAHESPPGRFPTKPVADALAKWPENTVERALFRVIVSAEETLSLGNASAQVAEGWLRTVAQASLRWRETGGADSRGYQAARVGELLVRLSRIAGDRTPQELLLQAGVLDGETDAWRRGFVAGLWEAFEGDDAREMYRRSSTVLGRQARADLAREIALAAFDPGYSARRNSELDRLLETMPEDQRRQILREMVASATPVWKDGVLDYIANSRHASGPEHLGLRTMAALALGGERSDFAAQTSRELSDAFERPEIYGEPVRSLFRDAAIKAGEAKISGRLQVKDLEQTHEVQIQQERQEQQRLRQQMQALDAELDARREESRLEIRQDMLLAVGEVLQSVCLRDSVEELAGDVEAGLTLALRAGGADLLETPGALVNYEPQRHQAKGDLPPSAMVKVLAPGVIVRGGVHGDRVLLKAHVKHEAG